MAYHVDKATGDLVIDSWQAGIAQSPYQGIGNIQGMNTQYYPGVAYVNYKRQAANLSGSTWYAGTHSINVSGNSGWIFAADSSSSEMGNPVQSATSPAGLNYILDTNGDVWKQNAVNSSSFTKIEASSTRYGNGNSGLAYWNNYIVVFGDNLIEFCGDGTGDATINSSHWNVSTNSGLNQTTVAASTSPSQLSFSENGYTYLVNDPVVFTSTGTMPSPLVSGTTYYIQVITLSTGTYTFQVSTTVGGSAITITGTGSGQLTMTDFQTPFPVGNYSNVTFTYTVPSTTATSLTLTAYTFPNGVASPDGLWRGPNGIYAIISPWNDKIFGSFIYGSNTVELPYSPQYLPTGTYSIHLIEPFVSNRAYVSKVDGNLYWGNGRYVGQLLAEDTTTNFNPGGSATYTVNYGTFSILQQSDSVVDMTDLNTALVVAGQKDVYTWDYISPSTTAPVPIGENIKRIINLLNNVYVFAGQKGNIYVSNGSYAQFLTKISSYISGVIDPVWTWGGIMTHRAKIFFQAMAQDTSGNNVMAGIFSLIVSPSLLGEVAQGMVVEGQNSVSPLPSGSTGQGVLIDNEPSSTGYDSYYSAYSTGASTGVLDYNNTIPWGNNEAFIESDMIPIGSFLDKKTLGQVQFTLDRQMVVGESITLYARSSLTDSWTEIGQTSGTQLGGQFPSVIAQGQWLQIRATFASVSDGSFIPLKEIRLQLT